MSEKMFYSGMYRELVKKAQQRAKDDKRTRWAFEGASWKREHYSSSFHGLISGRDFDKHFKPKRQERHSRGQQFMVLDLAAPPDSFISRIKEIDGGVSVGFKDKRSVVNRLSERKRNIRMVKANLLDHDTWRRVDEFMKKFEIAEEGFGAVTLVPIGAGSPSFSLVYVQRVLRPAWRRLSSSNGEMFVEVPSRFMISGGYLEVAVDDCPHNMIGKGGRKIVAWLDSLRESGIEVETAWSSGDFAFKLVKNESSPSKLPVEKVQLQSQ